MNKEMTDIEIALIVTEFPLRQDQGDLGTLQSSIESMGLLHPLVIDRNNILISGSRRLSACRAAGPLDLAKGGPLSNGAQDQLWIADAGAADGVDTGLKEFGRQRRAGPQ